MLPQLAKINVLTKRVVTVIICPTFRGPGYSPSFGTIYVPSFPVCTVF